MNAPLYILMRGRALGPFDEVKLKGLASRGQLSRMHKLSTDATNWVDASTYPELFVVEDAPSGTVERRAAANGTASPGPQPIPHAFSGRWWYHKDGSKAGPVDQSTLQQMLALGSLSPDDFVWMEGMPEWIPAQQAPGLLPTVVAERSQQGITSEQKEELPASLSKSAINSRSWVIFIAVVFFVYSGLSIIAGIFQLIVGARVQSPPIIAGSLFTLIIGLDCAAGGFLLSSYAARVRGLCYGTHPLILEKALDALRAFWIFASINLIIFLAFVIFAIVWAFAVGVSFP